MAQGSLHKHLHSTVLGLSWHQRYKIILDLGSALLYLYQDCDKCIIHGDIKPANVMLDTSYSAKLGDFGSASLVEHGAGPRTALDVAVTGAYADSEFVNSHLPHCPQADVYSFGVVLLEIATGRRPEQSSRQQQADETSGKRPAQSSTQLLDRDSHLFVLGHLLIAVDAKMIDDFDRQQMERVLVTGLWCAHTDPNQRPSIEQAMHVLRSANASLPVPPATRDPQRVRIVLRRTGLESLREI